jgi:hypothetical protein
VFEPNGGGLIIAGGLSYRSWNTNSWNPGPRLARAGLPIMALSNRGGLAAMCDEGQTSIQLRDIATGETVATLQSPVPKHLTALAFSPDDTQIAVAHWGTRELVVWDLRLLREELKQMGLDWTRPPYPPAAVEAPKAVQLRVMTNSQPASVPGMDRSEPASAGQ